MDLLPPVETDPAVSRGNVRASPPPASPPPARPPVPAPDTLHPALWLGHQLGRHTDQAVASGFPALDAQLPGGGWPRRVLTELLLPHPGLGEIRLLAPSLAAIQQAGRLVMLFDPPHDLCAWALAQLGLDVAQLLVINTRCKVVPGSDSLWALEQAYRERAPVAPPEVRWLLEELRVSHFAQGLGTREPVSAKRIRRLLAT